MTMDSIRFQGKMACASSINNAAKTPYTAQPDEAQRIEWDNRPKRFLAPVTTKQWHTNSKRSWGNQKTGLTIKVLDSDQFNRLTPKQTGSVPPKRH
jgi:hypothetical protein